MSCWLTKTRLWIACNIQAEETGCELNEISEPPSIESGVEMRMVDGMSLGDHETCCGAEISDALT